MSAGPKLVLFVFGVVACIPARLYAADSPDLLYKFHFSHRAAKVEWTAETRTNWEVTVSVDPGGCELLCAYRLRRGAPAANLLAPPTISIRVYSDFVSVPWKLTVDPAGLHLPRVAGKTTVSPDSPYVPCRKLAAVAPSAGERLVPASSEAQVVSAIRAATSTPSVLPLRI